MFLIHMGKYQVMQLLSYMVRLCLALQEVARLSSSMAVPFSISTSN